MDVLVEIVNVDRLLVKEYFNVRLDGLFD